MEKLLKPYDKEYMRVAMLKHEETFKEQVCELHRLYRIQKILMRKIEGNCRPSSGSQELWNAKTFKNSNHAHDRQQKSTLKLDLEKPAEEYVAESNDDRVLEFMDESEIQLTLGPTSYNRGRKKPETPRTSDSGPSFSSSSTGSSHINRTSQGTQQTTSYSPGQGFCNGGLVVQVNPEMALDCQVASKNDSEVEEQPIQERPKQPPWIFQVLSDLI
uniref:Uncharacterized protein LOC105116401 n=2 Tax=Rhizophora mucronata TaxID=61149 RepID=A0A2P2J6Y8_RHIMU